MARFKNISGSARHVGRVDGPLVEAGDVTSTDGDLVEEADDAYIVGDGDQARAWPKSTWELIPETKKQKGE